MQTDILQLCQLPLSSSMFNKDQIIDYIEE